MTWKEPISIEMYFYVVLFAILSYLIGSFSSAVWFGKWFFGVDVREHGSKNAGATNTFRVLGYKAGIPVFIADILKSFLAVQLIIFVPDISVESEFYYQIKLLFGVLAVIGHIFPIYTGFRGGKGVASMLGLVLALYPVSAGLTFGVFLIVFLISRIVSISSIIAAVSFPFIMYVITDGSSDTLTVFSVVAAVLIVITHKKNIKRLLKGEEKRISFRKSN
ncbi:MAG TPA: glycerol-3-phosphate 1-O-acyltransferase PlsY [Bacteroidales bacterium]|nr:glycerol-3-phosphate 1-O-acyltransferase PlsY [Bacteroidales bacterium]